jgi:hypothetical protein
LYVLSRIMLPGYVRQSLYQLSGRLALGNTCTYTRPTVRRSATRVPSCHRYGGCEGYNVNQRLMILVDGESYAERMAGWRCRRAYVTGLVCASQMSWQIWVGEGQGRPSQGALLGGTPAYLFRTSIPRFRMTSSPALCSGSFASG